MGGLRAGRMGGRSTVKTQPKPALMAMMGAGALMFLFSFLPFYKGGDAFNSVDLNAWDKGLFPLASFVGIFGLVGATMTAVRAFGNVKLPDRILTLSVKQ